MYEIEFTDGTRAPYAANKIAQEIYSEVYFEGRRDIILDEIIDHEVDWSKAIKKEDQFFYHKVLPCCHKTTAEWKLLLR